MRLGNPLPHAAQGPFLKEAPWPQPDIPDYGFKDFRTYLDSQVAQTNSPPYPKAAHNFLKVTRSSRPLAFQEHLKHFTDSENSETTQGNSALPVRAPEAALGGRGLSQGSKQRDAGPMPCTWCRHTCTDRCTQMHTYTHNFVQMIAYV